VEGVGYRPRLSWDEFVLKKFSDEPVKGRVNGLVGQKFSDEPVKCRVNGPVGQKFSDEPVKCRVNGLIGQKFSDEPVNFCKIKKFTLNEPVNLSGLFCSEFPISQ
jgi:hypothetical protein